MLKTLDDFDLIVGHNILNFDYLVLSPHFHGDIITHFSPKTVDTLLRLKEATNQLIGLNDLAILNLHSRGKSLNPKIVPSLWRSGKKAEVRQYCKNDVELLRDIYFLGKEQKKLRYTTKLKKIAEVSIDW